MTRRRAAVLGAVGTVVVVALVVLAVQLTRGGGQDRASRPQPLSAPSATATTPTPPSVRGALGVPDRLRIDAIDVDAKVIGVGTAANQAQEVPSSLSETGWWRDGQVPGQSGNAVVVGHTASKADGVFDRLGDVDRGDVVTMSSGKRVLRFRVTRTETVPVPDFASVADRVYARTGPRGLVLMTCGDWNGSAFTSTVIVSARAA